MCMRHIVICGLLRSTEFFHNISQKARSCEKSYRMQNVCLIPLQLLSETFIILRRNERDMIKYAGGLHVKYPLFLSDFNET